MVGVFPLATAPLIEHLIALKEFRCDPERYLLDCGQGIDDCLHEILQLLCCDAGDVLKGNLLVLLQDSMHFLLSDTCRMEQAFASLLSMVSQSSSDASEFFCSQVLITLTVVVVDLDLLSYQRKTFTSFCCFLFDIASHINSLNRIHVRMSALSCLRELELVTPGLFVVRISRVLLWTQDERTHALQGYVLLFSTMFVHLLRKLVQPDQTETTFPLLNVKSDLATPWLPPVAKECGERYAWWASTNNVVDLSDVVVNEVKRLLAHLLNSLPMLTLWARSSLVLQLLHVIVIARLPPQAFKRHMFRHIYMLCPLLVHLVVVLKFRLGDEAFEAGDESIILNRLICGFSSPLLEDNVRLLLGRWLLTFPFTTTNSINERGLHSLTQPHLDMLMPISFDSAAVIELKFSLLALCAPPDSDVGLASSRNFSPVLLEALMALDDFVYCQPSQRLSVLFFRSLYRLIVRFPDSLGPSVHSRILSIALEKPKFMPNIIDLIDSIGCTVTSEVNNRKALLRRQSLLSALASLTHKICSEKWAKELVALSSLLRRLAREPTINAAPLLRLLRDVLRGPTGICSSGCWELGDAVLSVCRAFVVDSAHPAGMDAAVYTELTNVLCLLSNTFSDIDVRDRAVFYYRLLTRVSADALRTILSSPVDDTSSVMLSTCAGVNSGVPKSKRLSAFKKPLLSLIRRSSNDIESDGDIDTDAYIKSILRKRDDSHGAVSCLKIHLRIQGTDYYHSLTANDKSNGADSYLSNLFGIELKLETEAEHCNCDNAVLAILSPDVGADISLVFRFTETLPAMFHVSSLFTAANSANFVAPLENFAVHFSDLLLPMSSRCMSTCLSDLFERLWSIICSVEMSDDNDYSLFSRRLLTSESFNLSADRVYDVLKGPLYRFVLDRSLISDVKCRESTDSVRLAIAIVPKQHALISMSIRCDYTNMRIAVDDWQVLPALRSFLCTTMTEP